MNFVYQLHIFQLKSKQHVPKVSSFVESKPEVKGKRIPNHHINRDTHTVKTTITFASLAVENVYFL